MKKRILSLLLCCVMLLGLMPTAVFAEGSTAPADITGSGASDDPYLIYTAAGLNAFRDKVNGQNGLTKQPGAHAKLMNDIVLNDGTFDENGSWSESGTPVAWEPIGRFESDSSNIPYTGTFNGNGHTVKGLYVKGVQYAGLFGYAKNATVKNVTVDGYITTERYSGGIAGYLSGGSVTNCFNYCTLNSKSTSGGIAGFIAEQCKITGCGNAGSVSGTNIGGVVGHAKGKCVIQNCYNVGAVSTYSCAGGIAGDSYNSSIIACYNTGTVIVSENAYGNAYVGGIIGNAFNSGSIYFCYWLKGTAKNAAGYDPEGTMFDPEKTVLAPDAKTKEEFADGTVLALLKNGENLPGYGKCDFPWEKCGYLSAAGMIVPLLKGQTSDTFPIYTAEDLKAFCDMVNSGESGAHAKLMEDIDLDGSDTNRWTPIGSKDKPYTGTFDGNGKKITGLYVDERGNNRSAGLFGYIEIADGNTPVVQNLTVDGTVFAGNETNFQEVNYSAGILVGYITVKSGSGVEYGTIKNCHASGTVSSSMQAGGFAGETKYTHFENCTADVEVEGYGSAYSGGFVGYTDQSEFKDCVAYGKVTADATVGGFAGLLYNKTTVTHCAAYGNVEADKWNVGGFVGYVEEKVTIKNSIAMGDVVSNYDSGTAKVGGFAGVATTGWDAVTFEKCHANGKVTTAEGKVGYGMFGQVRRSDFKSIGCSYNSEKNPSLDATNEGAWEGLEGKNTAGVLSDVCVHYKGGHDMEAVAAVAATCTENGSTAGQRCKDCGHTEGVTVISAPGHKYSDVWSVDETNHWHECTECGAKSDVGKHTDTDKSHKCDVCEKVLSECADTDKDHKCDFCGKTLSEHTGGTATCTDKAICEICGESYGELDGNNHADMKHIEAKAATKTDEGNIEYWYCDGCGMYFADKDGLKEITKADTVTAKLPEEKPVSPKTGDTSNLALWIALLFVSGGAVTATTVIGKKKKRSKE